MTPSVRLLSHTPQPTRAMALAARLCYTQGMSIEQVDKGLTDEASEALVKKVLSNRHHSVMEHAVFTFGVEGVSRNFTHQMVRHRNTSYEQQSLHYTLAKEDLGVAGAPPEEMGSQWKVAKELAFQAYRRAINLGMPREEARHILPSGIETKIIMTANLRQWLHFVAIRTCVVNCAEVITVAHKVSNLLEGLMPYLKPWLGPTCWTDKACHEGSRFCDAPWKDECVVFGNGEPYVWNRNRGGSGPWTSNTILCPNPPHHGLPLK